MSSLLGRAGPAKSPTASYPPYNTLIKSLLRYRSRYILLHAWLALHAMMVIATFNPFGLGFGVIFSPLFPRLIVATTFQALPLCVIFLLRRQQFTSRPYRPSTRFSLFVECFLRHPAKFLTNVVLSIGAALAMLAVHVSASNKMVPGSNLNMLIRTPGRDSLQLNDRFLYLALLTILTASVVSIYNAFTQRHVLRFSLPTQPIPERLKAALEARLVPTFKAITIGNLLFFFFYLFFRKPLIRFFVLRINPFGFAAKPYLFAIMRRTSPSLSIFIRGVIFSTLIVVSWEICNTLFDVYATQPMEVSQYSSNPNQTLLSGLRSEDPFYQFFAYHELAVLAETSESRRKNIYSDISSNPNMWTSLNKELQSCLSTFHGTLLRRGQPVPAPSPPQPGATPSPSPAPPQALTPSKHSKAKVEAAGLKPSAPPTGLVSRLFDSVLAPTAQATAVSSALSLTHLPPTLRGPVENVESRLSAVVTSTSASTTQRIQTFEGRVASVFPKGYFAQVHDWMFSELLETKVMTAAADWQICELTCVALAHLVTRSLQEDTYGLVQGSIPGMLESMVGLLDDLETYVEEVSPISSNDPHKRKLVEDTVGQVVNALKDCLVCIGGTFQPYMEDFKLNPRLVIRLKNMVDWGQRPVE